MGEAELTLNQAEDKPPEPGLCPAEEPLTWSHEVEVCLFHAMIGHKPVGVNRHFHMMCIRDKFSQNIGRQVSSDFIWNHLSTMYDMQALHESEILPFPNSERSFCLPDDLLDQREGVCEEELKQELDLELPVTVEESSNSSVKSDRSKESNSKDEKKKRSPPASGVPPPAPANKGAAPVSATVKASTGPPPVKAGASAAPPAKQGANAAPPAKQGASTAPPAKQGASTAPPTKQGASTAPPAKPGATTAPQAKAPVAPQAKAPAAPQAKAGSAGTSSSKSGSSGPSAAKRRR